jgi:hypothetical protein
MEGLDEYIAELVDELDEFENPTYDDIERIVEREKTRIENTVRYALQEKYWERQNA